MLQKVRIQILDNPMEAVILNAEEFEGPARNRSITDELRNELVYYYPTMVSVEYIDLFDDNLDFPEMRELLRRGNITTPIVLINGIPRIHGGIPRAVIRDEVEKLISSGPVH